MRLIDADVLTERLNNAIECGRRVDMPTLELEAVLVDVQNAPSIDIVRRKPVVGYEGYYEVEKNTTFDTKADRKTENSSEKPNNSKGRSSE